MKKNTAFVFVVFTFFCNTHAFIELDDDNDVKTKQLIGYYQIAAFGKTKADAQITFPVYYNQQANRIIQKADDTLNLKNPTSLLDKNAKIPAHTILNYLGVLFVFDKNGLVISQKKQAFAHPVEKFRNKWYAAYVYDPKKYSHFAYAASVGKCKKLLDDKKMLTTLINKKIDITQLEKYIYYGENDNPFSFNDHRKYKQTFKPGEVKEKLLALGLLKKKEKK